MACLVVVALGLRVFGLTVAPPLLLVFGFCLFLVFVVVFVFALLFGTSDSFGSRSCFPAADSIALAVGLFFLADVRGF